jgi:hypothetical protein
MWRTHGKYPVEYEKDFEWFGEDFCPWDYSSLVFLKGAMTLVKVNCEFSHGVMPYLDICGFILTAVVADFLHARQNGSISSRNVTKYS